MKSALLPPTEGAACVANLAEAIHKAHEKGVIHRDLKPANVLLAADGTLKIADFGLAKQMADSFPSLTATEAILGTPSYMSPEQAAGRPVGLATDIHALGAILYELLTGRPPYLSATREETLEQVKSQEPVPPRRYQSQVPRDLETICLKCLEKNPDRRYGTAEALAEDLRRFLRKDPILARPVGRAERVTRWTRRHPLGAVSTGFALVMLLGLVTGTALLLAKDKQTQAALKEQATQRCRADANFRRALGALIDVTLKVKSAKYQGPKDLIDHDFQFFRTFIDEQSTEPSVRFETGCAYLYVGQLHAMQTEHDKAIEAYHKAVSILEPLAVEVPSDPYYRQEAAQAHTFLGKGFEDRASQTRGAAREQDLQKSKEEFRRALENYREAVRRNPQNWRGLNYLAVTLTTCGDTSLRNYPEAVQSAEKALRSVPNGGREEGSCQNTLGMARYAVGDWVGAIKALEQAKALHAPQLRVYDWYYLAKANWKLGNKSKAHQCYQEAESCRANSRDIDDDTASLAREAATMLELKISNSGKEKECRP